MSVARYVVSRGTESLFTEVRGAFSFGRRLRGLMFAPPLLPGEGLLLFPCASVHTLAMRQSIDVIFLDACGVVLRCRADLVPWRAAACAGACHVLEVAAGGIAATKLAAGQRLAWAAR